MKDNIKISRYHYNPVLNKIYMHTYKNQDMNTDICQEYARLSECDKLIAYRRYLVVIAWLKSFNLVDYDKLIEEFDEIDK